MQGWQSMTQCPQVRAEAVPVNCVVKKFLGQKTVLHLLAMVPSISFHRLRTADHILL